MHGEELAGPGKKESRQIDQVIDKAAKKGNRAPTGKEARVRITPKQHSLKGDKVGK